MHNIKKSYTGTRILKQIPQSYSLPCIIKFLIEKKHQISSNSERLILFITSLFNNL